MTPARDAVDGDEIAIGDGDVRDFAVSLRNDGGTITIITAATSVDNAVLGVLAGENAPRTAVYAVRVRPICDYCDQPATRYHIDSGDPLCPGCARSQHQGLPGGMSSYTRPLGVSRWTPIDLPGNRSSLVDGGAVMSTPHRVRVTPGDTVTLTLPYTEVCMHLRVAGSTRAVRVLDAQSAQLLDERGTPYSTPILLGEAGILTDHTTTPPTLYVARP